MLIQGLSLLVAAASASSTGLRQIHPMSTRGGVVVSDSTLASEVGAEILRLGGNADDAAVATGFALAVTFPEAGNLGGGGFMLVRMATGEPKAIDYREIAPSVATKTMFVGPDGKILAGRSTRTRFGAGVPGTVAGLWEAHCLYGKLRWEALVEPAVALAADGFVLTEGRAASFRSGATKFRPNADSWRIFCRNGDFYREGERFRQPELARTLRRIRDNGRAGFYEGSTARSIAEDSKKNGGAISEGDLGRYRVETRSPVEGSYRGYVVLSMPPPSSGGIALIQMLHILEPLDLREMGPGSSAYTHWLIEAMKRAFADRAVHVGDPGFVAVPVDMLLARPYAESIRKGIHPERATPSAEIRAGVFPPPEGLHTTHFSVVDRDGNAIANTYTINESFGSGAVAEGLGFLLNNEMDDFTSAPGVANAYGLIQGESNSIQPGKRPLSSMTPTIVLKDGALFLVLGSPGGPTIINTVLQTLLNVIDHRMTIQEAVSYPRFHHQWLPDSITCEPRAFSADVRRILESMGHSFGSSSARIGSCHAIQIDPATRKRLAGVDPRIRDAGAAASG